ncbi:MAG: alpha/beta fold hydrolase [Phycisphaerales bacterium]
MSLSIRRRLVPAAAILALAGLAPAWAAFHAAPASASAAGVAPLAPDTPSAELDTVAPRVSYRTTEIEGLEIFYREAGSADAPVVLLLHGFPTSSHMFRELIPELASEYRVIAPDYPGFGESATPPRDEYDYTFANAADIVGQLIDELGVESYSVYLMDYGAPVGFRLFEAEPERVDACIIQNGNAYDEGLREFWDPIKAYWAERTEANAAPLREFLNLEGTKWQYTHGVRNVENISPDTWNHVQPKLDRPGNKDIQLDYFYDYRTNVDRYDEWQRLFREHQPPTLITWGTGDYIFPTEGAHPYRRDLEDVEFHLLETGHFALEEDGDVIAGLMLDFLGRKVGSADR